jgi:predicted GIY-YIG superfamily endonuclease
MTAHNGNEAEDWTTVYRPWTLIHMELFADEAEALVREGYLDSEQGKEYIRADILPMYDFN